MKIPGFKIDRLIADGGMSSVYLAVQESLDRRVALKVLRKFCESLAKVKRGPAFAVAYICSYAWQA